MQMGKYMGMRHTYNIIMYKIIMMSHLVVVHGDLQMRPAAIAWSTVRMGKK